MELIRGRWTEQYINCIEDKRNYDSIMRGRMHMHHELAQKYCAKYNLPDLTSEEKEEIRSYWSQYGIQLTDFSYHRMYYSVTGIRDPKFVPDFIAGHVVYAYYNDHAYEYTWRDKNMFDRLLPDVPLPTLLAKCCRGRFIVEDEYYTLEKLSEISKRIYQKMVRDNEIYMIIKPTRNSGFGRGVKKYTVESPADIKRAIFDWMGVQDFIIQECVHQHKVLASFNESSSNMLRVCSWRHGSTVDILYAAARVGIPGSITDVAFVNGEELVRMVGITQDGHFRDQVLNQDGILEKQIDGHIAVPGWNKIIKVIKQNHLKIDNFDIVGWDFTVDDNENPICFEWNIQWPGTVLYQYVNGPLWGEFTDDILSFLNDKRNQDNYIPWYLR